MWTPFCINFLHHEFICNGSWMFSLVVSTFWILTSLEAREEQGRPLALRPPPPPKPPRAVWGRDRKEVARTGSGGGACGQPQTGMAAVVVDLVSCRRGGRRDGCANATEPLLGPKQKTRNCWQQYPWQKKWCLVLVSTASLHFFITTASLQRLVNGVSPFGPCWLTSFCLLPPLPQSRLSPQSSPHHCCLVPLLIPVTFCIINAVSSAFFYLLRDAAHLLPHRCLSLPSSLLLPPVLRKQAG